MVNADESGGLAAKEQAAVHHASAARYVVVWVALTILTLLTWVLSYAHLGAWHIVVGLTIGAVKASLVGLFFMHLWEETGAGRLAFGISIFFLVLLVGFSLTDVVVRFRPATPAWGVRGDRHLR